MNIADRMRLESWVQRYDFWLDARGVPGGVRNDLRREVRANLEEAAQAVGLPAALAGAGTPRAMAGEAAEAAADPTRPTWGHGWAWLAGILVGGMLLTALIAGAFFEGVAASGVSTQVRHRMVLLPGLTLVAQHNDDAIAVGTEGFPWLWAILAILGFLLGSRIWRLAIPRAERQERVRLPRRRSESAPGWVWGLVVGLTVFMVASSVLTGNENGFTIVLRPDTRWWFALPLALATGLLAARPWRRR